MAEMASPTHANETNRSGMASPSLNPLIMNGIGLFNLDEYTDACRETAKAQRSSESARAQAVAKCELSGQTSHRTPPPGKRPAGKRTGHAPPESRENDKNKWYPACSSHSKRGTLKPVQTPPDAGRVDGILNAAQALRAALRDIQSATEEQGVVGLQGLFEDAEQRATALTRRACATCDEHSVDLTVLSNAIREEWVDLSVQRGTIAERQRVLHGNGNREETQLLVRASKAADIVTRGLTRLHAYASHARPDLSLVNPAVFDALQRIRESER